ncbi:hypothetical protein M0804_003301 [Polistes exclamans]|nr:hypothetical protein M0804_003301 [Polistes exclamans]
MNFFKLSITTGSDWEDRYIPIRFLGIRKQYVSCKPERLRIYVPWRRLPIINVVTVSSGIYNVNAAKEGTLCFYIAVCIHKAFSTLPENAGLLAVLSFLHIASSILERRIAFQSNSGTDSVGESLLNARAENYDRFEEVLVPEVLDDGVSGPTIRIGDSDGEI